MPPTADAYGTSRRAEAVASSPTVAGGVVYVGSDDNQVYALNASDGGKLWSYLQATW